MNFEEFYAFYEEFLASPDCFKALKVRGTAHRGEDVDWSKLFECDGRCLCVAVVSRLGLDPRSVPVGGGGRGARRAQATGRLEGEASSRHRGTSVRSPEVWAQRIGLRHYWADRQT